jgi:hypothetical protein
MLSVAMRSGAVASRHERKQAIAFVASVRPALAPADHSCVAIGITGPNGMQSAEAIVRRSAFRAQQEAGVATEMPVTKAAQESNTGRARPGYA